MHVLHRTHKPTMSWDTANKRAMLTKVRKKKHWTGNRRQRETTLWGTKLRELMKRLICFRISRCIPTVAQSRRVKPVSCVKLLFTSLSCKYQNLSISLWGKHSCSACIILHKHLAILFELCSSTHYTSFEEWMLEKLYILILLLLNATEQQITSKLVFWWLIINSPCAVASRKNSGAKRKLHVASVRDD